MKPTTDQRILDHMRAGKFRHYWKAWDFAIELKLTRATVRKALNRLAENGLVVRMPSHIVSEDHKWRLPDQEEGS